MGIRIFFFLFEVRFLAVSFPDEMEKKTNIIHRAAWFEPTTLVLEHTNTTHHVTIRSATQSPTITVTDTAALYIACLWSIKQLSFLPCSATRVCVFTSLQTLAGHFVFIIRLEPWLCSQLDGSHGWLLAQGAEGLSSSLPNTPVPRVAVLKQFVSVSSRRPHCCSNQVHWV
jgi:hypothetical protein